MWQEIARLCMILSLCSSYLLDVSQLFIIVANFSLNASKVISSFLNIYACLRTSLPRDLISSSDNLGSCNHVLAESDTKIPECIDSSLLINCSSFAMYASREKFSSSKIPMVA